jgi:formylglycine-generating enzyme required for sulfatase activity
VLARRFLFGVAAMLAGCTLVSGASELTVGLAQDPDGAASASDSTASVDDAAADAPARPCPSERGPGMVRIVDRHGTFCIDATETTNRQLNAFLGSAERFDAGAECAFKTTYGGALRADDDLPAVNVDWCDAWMYCRWAGKRLCGSRNGTRILDFVPANDERVSEWFAACSRSGQRSYPYGDDFDAQTCNACARTGSCATDAAPHAPVASNAGCVGGYDGVFDMSGGAAEWEDNCDDGDICPPRGGSISNGQSGLTCAITTGSQRRDQANDRFGIRCCAD